jgi:phosphoglucomutase
MTDETWVDVPGDSPPYADAYQDQEHRRRVIVDEFGEDFANAYDRALIRALADEIRRDTLLAVHTIQYWNDGWMSGVQQAIETVRAKAEQYE